MPPAPSPITLCHLPPIVSKSVHPKSYSCWLWSIPLPLQSYLRDLLDTGTLIAQRCLNQRLGILTVSASLWLEQTSGFSLPF